MISVAHKERFKAHDFNSFIHEGWDPTKMAVESMIITFQFTQPRRMRQIVTARIHLLVLISIHSSTKDETKYAIGDLPYTKEQDRYSFTPDDLAQLDAYNIVTYAYVLDSARLTSSRMSADDVHIDTILGWDWIQNQITIQTTHLFVQNAKEGIPYSEVGFDAIITVIRGVFLDAGDLDIIAPELDASGLETGKPDYSVDYAKPGELPKTYETKREMRGVKTKYHPMGMVEDVYIENTIVM